MEGKDTQFLAEMYHLVKKMEDLIEEFEVKDRLLASIVIGLFNEEDMNSDEDIAQVKTMYSFHLESRDELNVIKELMDEMYEPDEDPLGGLLGDLGISLN
jgi:hypothetical protein|tara:strand:+ start:1212 stop:1511 length:300 start_codon:yes stop_codon:yes gene_type:complete